MPIRWTRFCENYFSGDLDLAKPRLILFLDFVRAEEGSGEESARAFGILAGASLSMLCSQGAIGVLLP